MIVDDDSRILSLQRVLWFSNCFIINFLRRGLSLRSVKKSLQDYSADSW